MSAKVKIKPSFDELQEAYEEASEHLDMVQGQAKHEWPESQRAAYRVVAARIRSAAKRALLKTRL